MDKETIGSDRIIGGGKYLVENIEENHSVTVTLYFQSKKAGDLFIDAEFNPEKTIVEKKTVVIEKEIVPEKKIEVEAKAEIKEEEKVIIEKPANSFSEMDVIRLQKQLEKKSQKLELLKEDLKNFKSQIEEKDTYIAQMHMSIEGLKIQLNGETKKNLTFNSQVESIEKASYKGALFISEIGATLSKEVDSIVLLVLKMCPYCIFYVDNQKLQTEPHKNAGKNPMWNDKFSLEITKGSSVSIEVRDKSSSSLVGHTSFSLFTLHDRGKQEIHLTLWQRGARTGMISFNAEFNRIDQKKKIITTVKKKK